MLSPENHLLALPVSIGFPSQNIIRLRPTISNIKAHISVILNAPHLTYYDSFRKPVPLLFQQLITAFSNM